MSREYELYYAGKWQAGQKVREVRSPYDGKVVSRCQMGGEKHLNDAIEHAHSAFEEMRHLSAWQRSKILNQIAEGIEQQRDDFARAIVEEAGKPISLARGEVARAVHTARIGAIEAERLGDESIALDTTEKTKGFWGSVRRFPLGVVGGIAPFNFPLNLVAHKLVPALASGNTIVLKPASQTPGGAVLLAGVVAATDIPKGAVAVVPSPGGVAEAMARDDRVKKLTFTGSADIGWSLKQKAWKKRVTLELGGNAATVVHDDADLEKAAAQLVGSGYGYAGQVCISTQRIMVQESVYKDFRERFVAAVRDGAKMGDPNDESVIVGPMIEEDAAKRVEDWVNEAASRGARVLLGGKRQGTFYEPTVLENVEPSCKVWCEEAFAPVTALAPYKRFDDALRMVNDSRYGLQAGVFTRDLDCARKAFTELEVGGVTVNQSPTFRVDSMPYGGVKDSGFGREGVRYAIEEMTEIRLVVFA
jgi:glyceraldehyde-3-phosphate dehydrogenase (NADP+)